MSSGFSWLAARGRTDYFVEHVFGLNSAVGTTYSTVVDGGVYNTPQYSESVQLRVRGGNLNDTVDGLGARKIRLIGMGADGCNIIEDIDTAGAVAGALSTNVFVRLFRAQVLESGSYSKAGTPSHYGEIIIESSLGDQWGKIDNTDIGRGVTQIGAFTVPNKLSNGIEIAEAYVLGYTLTVDTGKSCDMMLLSRSGANALTAPYQATKVVREHLQIQDVLDIKLSIPLGPYLPNTDVIAISKAVISAGVSVDIEIALVKK